MNPLGRASDVESAKILRRELKGAFPSTKFSVVGSQRSTTYTVRWLDGPTVALVEEITRRYEGKGFDGMTDCTTYTRATLPDGRESGIGYLFTSRTISADLARRCVAQLVAYWGGIEIVPVVLERGESFELESGMGNRSPRPDMHDDWYTLIHQAAANGSRFAREER